MASVEEYRQNAAHCLALARKADNPNDKARVLRMAEAWIALADKLARHKLALKG